MPNRSMTVEERTQWETDVRLSFPHIRLQWSNIGGEPGADDSYDTVYWMIAHDVSTDISADGKLVYWAQANGYWFEYGPNPEDRYHTLNAPQFCEQLKALILADPNMLWPYGDDTSGLPDPWPEGVIGARAGDPSARPKEPPSGLGAVQMRGPVPRRG